jgi:deoxyribodipyrimidine photo-lyase
MTSDSQYESVHLHPADSPLRRTVCQAAWIVICNPSRTDALDQLGKFISVAGLYARDRNHVKSNHPSVSRLSPAIRHRLIREEETVTAVLRVHPFDRVEKFIQEVYWRRYWKSWLALRPEVWTDFLKDLADLQDEPSVQRVENAQSGNALIDSFTNELVNTGYLHNHARMWYAAWWVHEARLPWQSGAAFFYRHLLDGDPASNTLSWRWVAGLQTPGKTYLARRSNLEKYLAPELLNPLSESLEDFENPQALSPGLVFKPPITQEDWPLESLTSSPATGLWIHEEDLSAETSSLGPQAFSSIIVTGDCDTWDHYRFPDAKRQWITDALQDATMRAEQQWRAPTLLDVRQPIADALVQWTKANALDQIATLRPEVGPLNDSMPRLQAALSQAGIRLVLIDRPEDLSIRHFATGGFFQFWERLRKTLIASHGKNTPSRNQQLLIDFPK